MEDLLEEDGRVTGVQGKHGDETLALEARLVVGDDGGNSVVRTHLGIPIALDSFPIDFITALIPRWPLPPNRVRAWIHPKGFRNGLPAAAFIPWPGNEGVLLMPLAADRAKRLFEQPPEVFWSALERVTPMAGSLREQVEFPRDFRRVARPFGHAGSYVANGAALIGDAAHPMTPAGGQGANASIWDALALADVADAALRTDDVSRERLLPYERLRHPVNDESVSFSRVARRIFRFGRFLPLAIVLPLDRENDERARLAPTKDPPLVRDDIRSSAGTGTCRLTRSTAQTKVWPTEPDFRKALSFAARLRASRIFPRRVCGPRGQTLRRVPGRRSIG